MKKRDAIQRAKGRDNLARLLGITGSAISQWGEDVPLLREFQLRKKKPHWFRAPKAPPRASSARA